VKGGHKCIKELRVRRRARAPDARRQAEHSARGPAGAEGRSEDPRAPGDLRAGEGNRLPEELVESQENPTPVPAAGGDGPHELPRPQSPAGAGRAQVPLRTGHGAGLPRAGTAGLGRDTHEQGLAAAGGGPGGWPGPPRGGLHDDLRGRRTGAPAAGEGGELWIRRGHGRGEVPGDAGKEGRDDYSGGGAAHSAGVEAAAGGGGVAAGPRERAPGALRQPHGGVHGTARGDTGPGHKGTGPLDGTTGGAPGGGGGGPRERAAGGVGGPTGVPDADGPRAGAGGVLGVPQRAVSGARGGWDETGAARRVGTRGAPEGVRARQLLRAAGVGAGDGTNYDPGDGGAAGAAGAGGNKGIVT